MVLCPVINKRMYLMSYVKTLLKFNTIKIALVVSLLLFVSVGCQGDPIRDGLYIESVHLTGQSEGTAPLVIEAGTLATSPTEGTIEYDGERLYLTNVDKRRIFSRASDSIIESTNVTNTTNETVIYTATINTGGLVTHKVFRVFLAGQFSTHNATVTTTIRIKINGTVLAILSSTPGVVTDEPWHGDAIFTVRNEGETGTISSHADLKLGNADETHFNISSFTLNTTIPTAITVTAEWDIANPGSSISLDQAFVEVLD